MHESPPTATIRDGTLWLGERAVLTDVPRHFSVEPDPAGQGCFLRCQIPSVQGRMTSPLGNIAGLRRFTSCHRDEPFWMSPLAGKKPAEISPETQWLLAETSQGDCVMLVPLPDGPMVHTLDGSKEAIVLQGESCLPDLHHEGGAAIFVAVGPDPYELMTRAAPAVSGKLGGGRLRREKPVPDFVNDFGWCTWDSFYREVSAEGVRIGLQSFRAGGVEPRLLILDDGWQDYREEAEKEDRLISLEPNQERFGGDLRPTVQLAKEEFKTRTLLVWHAFTGYWSGVSTSMKDYHPQLVQRQFGAGILRKQPKFNEEYWGTTVGVVPPGNIAKFYDDYHRRLAEAGVDGVKVDNQSMIESVSHAFGGRVALTRAYRQALEESVERHFGGRMINCMANAMETYYFSPESTLMRTSIDFWPKRPETHGAHLQCNAQVGMWFGEFMQPDWDMFQSGHATGGFHAAGRAVSGGPVYVSDKPAEHSFDLLRKLVLSDGSVLRADHPGRPTRDCLFADVTRDPVLLKVFNTNRDCGVVGIFNANYHPEAADAQRLSGTVAPSDVVGLSGTDFAGFAHRSGAVWRTTGQQAHPVELAEGEWEVVSFAPVENGAAVFGLADKLNSTGAVISRKWTGKNRLALSLRDGGRLLLWTLRAPESVETGGQKKAFQHDPASGRLTVELPPGQQEVTVVWSS